MPFGTAQGEMMYDLRHAISYMTLANVMYVGTIRKW